MATATGNHQASNARNRLDRTGTVRVVIGVHNNVKYTLECLSAFARQTYWPIEVIIVDDGSTDGTAERVREKFPAVIVLRGDGNLWWTGTMRVGIEYVMRHSRQGDYILSMNNDVIFEPDYVEGLVAVSERRGRAAQQGEPRSAERALVGSHGVVRGTGKISVQGGRFDWRVGRSNQDIRQLQDPNDSAILHKLDFLYGRGMLIPVEVVEAIGNFDNRNFIQMRSDKEFSYRAARAGFPLVISLTAKVYVAETPETSSVSFSATPTISYAQAWRVLAHKNSSYHLPTGWRFIKKCCPPSLRWRNYALFLLSAFDRSLGRTIPLYYAIELYRRLLRG